MDPSNGYERVAAEFLAGRGRAPPSATGATHVRNWAHSFVPGTAVLDLGCGPGIPITKVLVDKGLDVYAVDAAPSLVTAFRRNFPQATIACESVLESSFFNRTFDGIVAWGLMFLLQADEQRELIEKIGAALAPGGRLLFTSPALPLRWIDIMTGLESRSLGAPEYRRLLSAVGVRVLAEYEDAGQNHYFDALREPTS